MSYAGMQAGQSFCRLEGEWVTARDLTHYLNSSLRASVIHGWIIVPGRSCKVASVMINKYQGRPRKDRNILEPKEAL